MRVSAGSQARTASARRARPSADGAPGATSTRVAITAAISASRPPPIGASAAARNSAGMGNRGRSIENAGGGAFIPGKWCAAAHGRKRPMVCPGAGLSSGMHVYRRLLPFLRPHRGV